MKPLPRTRRPKLPADEKNRETLRGARALARALVRQSVETIRTGRETLLSAASTKDQCRTALREIGDEVRWLTSTCRHPLGFEEICGALGLNAQLIRRQLAGELGTVPGRHLRKYVDALLTDPPLAKAA